MTRRLRRGEWIAFVVVLAAVLTIVLWPTHVDAPVDGALSHVLAALHRHGVPGWVDYDFVQSAANVVMFLPVGALLASLFVPQLWWASGVLGLTLSLCIEFTQYTFLPGRTASAGDLMTNTGGALVGGALVAIVRWSRAPGLESEPD
ncbi:VanZ family protein [Frondihabitans sp. PAMC 28766]|uniref:VanZ family protein n=1 Tax=Frondihabitans sp. PAMC 28766 TaxID=1795630 RepID=UPI0012FF669D|nr:VanZ family protein [Frondihabitans sp. PAMC 28766]